MRTCKKLISCLIAFALIFSWIPIETYAFTANDTNAFQLVGGSVKYSADQSKPVEVKFIGTSDDSYKGLQGIFATQVENSQIALSQMTTLYTVVADNPNYEANAQTGAFKFKDSSSPLSSVTGQAIITATYTVPAGTAPGDYVVSMELTQAIDNTGAFGNQIKDATYTATITVTPASVSEETSDYEIWYELDSTADDTLTKNYKDYQYNTTEGATNQVKAEIFLKSTKADVTVQAYDIYLSHNTKLTYSGENTMAGAVYKTVDVENKIAAAKGDQVSHIQLVKDSGKTINLTAGEAESLGAITFDIASSAIYDEDLEITLKVAADTENTAKTADVTNISLATTTGGQVASFYPMNTGTDLGAEVVTTYTVNFEANADSDTTVIGMPTGNTATKQYNVAMDLPTLSRENYTFKGWALSSSATEADYQAGAGTYPAEKNEENVTLYAVWTPNTFTVTWYGTDGTEIYNENVNSGSTTSFDQNNYTEPSKAPDKQYTYTFKGWSASENPALNAEVVDLATYKINEATNFYPVFSTTTNKYTVTWYNGSTLLENDADDEAVEYNGAPSYNSAEPTMADSDDGQYSYEFKGWTDSPDPDYNAEIVDLTTYKVTDNTAFYAVFYQNTKSYTVEFSTDHGTKPLNQTIGYGSKATNPGNLTAEHYTFDGWYTDKTYNTEYDFNTMTITGATTIYAKWTPKTYTVTFYSNGGTGSMTAQTFTYGVSQALTANGFTAPAGKAFQNWNTEALGTGTSYGAGEEISLSANLALYAQWTDASYDVTVKEGIQNGSVTVSKEKANYENEIELTIKPAEGYELDELTVTGANGTSVTVTDNKFTMPDSSVEVNATFKLATYQVKVAEGITNGTVSADPTSGNMNTPISLEVKPSTGYKVKSVSYTKDGETTAVPVTETNGTYSFNLPAANVTVNAEFEGIGYTVKFDKNAADANGTVSDIFATFGEDVTLSETEFSRNGYTFKGWNTKNDGTGTSYNVSTTITDDLFTPTGENQSVTLYAVWEANKYTVILDYGYEKDNGSISVAYNDKYYPTLTDVSRDGYTFDGWYDAETNGSKITKDTVMTKTEQHTLYAYWTANKYDITLDTNDGTINNGNVTEYTYGVGATLPTDVSKPGYRFDGWYTDENWTTKVTEISKTDIDDKTYHAKWTVITYKITLDPDGGTITDAGWTLADGKYTMTYTIETQTVNLPVPVREYYTFTDWNVATEAGRWATGDYAVKDTDGNVINYSGYYGDVTLKAEWTRAATPVVEEYKYAYTDYWMIRVPVGELSTTQEYKFDGKSMYYIEDTNYNIDGKGVFYTLIPVEYIKDGVLTDDGYNKLAIDTCTSRAVIDYSNRDINGDTVVNIADANVVYQMVTQQSRGGYYSDGEKENGQLNIEQRLRADLDKASAEHRGSIADVNVIVNQINGVVETTNP